MKSPFAFERHGGCGQWVSGLFRSIYDFHATALHPVGLDHKRLTEVHGEMIEKVLV